MADIVSQTSRLSVELFFVDGDTRTMTLKNPRGDITSSDMSELNTLIQTDNLLVGDNSGATFGKITKATRITSQTTQLTLDN